MRQTPDEITQKLAERLCWEIARRDDSRVARRLYRRQLVDGVYRIDEGAFLDDFFHFLQAIGVMSLLEEAHSAAVQRAMIPFVQYVLLYALKTLFGIESMNALPHSLFSDEALMQLVGFNAQQVRQGICQRRATTRQGERLPGPICPDTVAKNIVKWHLRDLETTARYTGCGQVTRTVRLEDTRGQVHAIEVTVYGWNESLLIDALTKIPLVVNVGPIQEHEALWARALVTQARLNLAGHARLHKVVFDEGFWDGTTL
jgi:hypothetical protein